MSKSLEARVSKMEDQIGRREDALTVILICFVPAIDGRPGELGELRGYRNAPYGMEPVDTIRETGESEAELLARAKSSARTVGGIFTFHELRH